MLIGQQIEILDSTLREGEQTPGVSFTVGQKIALAKRLDTFGVDFIELGHPAVSPDVYEAVEALNDLDLNAKKWLTAERRSLISMMLQPLALDGWVSFLEYLH